MLASVFGHMYVYLPQCQCQLLLWSDGFPEVCVFFPYQWIYFVQNFIELMSSHVVVFKELLWKLLLVYIQSVELTFS